MSRILPLMMIFAALTSYAETSASSTAANELEVRRIAEEWKEAYNRNDAAGAAALYAPDGYYVSQHVRGGILRGRDNIKANIQRGITGGGHIDSVEILTLDISGDLAYSVGTYHATNSGVQVTGRNIVVMKKQAGKWLIVAHTSVVPEQP